jgi:hypothetical protein
MVISFSRVVPLASHILFLSGDVSGPGAISGWMKRGSTCWAGHPSPSHFHTCDPLTKAWMFQVWGPPSLGGDPSVWGVVDWSERGNVILLLSLCVLPFPPLASVHALVGSRTLEPC